jgi:hypothetical protein
MRACGLCPGDRGAVAPRFIAATEFTSVAAANIEVIQ